MQQRSMGVEYDAWSERLGTDSPMCSCHTHHARGCWEHGGAEPRLINAYQLGFNDGKAIVEKPYHTPVSKWPADEQDWYEAGWALATGKARKVVAS